jgi:hypothetical protein
VAALLHVERKNINVKQVTNKRRRTRKDKSNKTLETQQKRDKPKTHQRNKRNDREKEKRRKDVGLKKLVNCQRPHLLSPFTASGLRYSYCQTVALAGS